VAHAFSEQTTENGAFMEPVVATGGNRSQIQQPPKVPKQAKTVAVGCDRLPIAAHGKEGVDGSSPSEGSAKAPHVGPFSCAKTLLILERAVGMEPRMEPSGSPFPPQRPHVDFSAARA
jgi:hypothetical protein